MKAPAVVTAEPDVFPGSVVGWDVALGEFDKGLAVGFGKPDRNDAVAGEGE